MKAPDGYSKIRTLPTEALARKYVEVLQAVYRLDPTDTLVVDGAVYKRTHIGLGRRTVVDRTFDAAVVAFSATVELRLDQDKK